MSASKTDVIYGLINSARRAIATAISSAIRAIRGKKSENYSQDDDDSRRDVLRRYDQASEGGEGDGEEDDGRRKVENPMGSRVDRSGWKFFVKFSSQREKTSLSMRRET